MKGKHAKGRRVYIAWEEEDESSSSSSDSISNDEYFNLCLMEHDKIEDSEVYTFDPKFKPSYKELSKDFSEMYAYTLNTFKKISIRRKLISKLEKEINDLNSALDSLNEGHTSLVVESFIKFGHKENGYVTYGDNIRGKILGENVVGNPSTITIEGVLLVKGLKHSLLSVSQLYGKGYYIVFDTLS